MRWSPIVAILVLCSARIGATADQPISGAKLTLRRSSSGKEKLVFASKDPLFLFPAIGSADDPSTGSPGGALLELASTTEPSGTSFYAPPVVGKPGWTAKSGNVDAYIFKNPAAAPGPSALKVIVLKSGKRIKVSGRGVGLALTAPQGGVGVRLTTGSLRNCTFFAPATVRHDDPGRFVASDAPASGLADCASVIPTTTTTTLILDPCSGGAGFPTCDGTCTGADTCQPTGSLLLPNPLSCLCYPPGITSCAASAYPTCGGSCPTGGACQAFRDVVSGDTSCGCADPSQQCGTPNGTCNAGICPPGPASVCLSVSFPQQVCDCGTP